MEIKWIVRVLLSIHLQFFLCFIWLLLLLLMLLLSLHVPRLYLRPEQNQIHGRPCKVDPCCQQEDGPPCRESLVALSDGTNHCGDEEVGGTARKCVADSEKSASKVRGQVNVTHLGRE